MVFDQADIHELQIFQKGRCTSVIGKLQEIIMEGEVVVNRGESSRSRGQLPDTLVLTHQNLQVVIWEQMGEDNNNN